METRFADLPTSEKGIPCHAIGRFNILGALSRVGYSAVCHLPKDHDSSHAGLVVWEGVWENEEDEMSETE